MKTLSCVALSVLLLTIPVADAAAFGPGAGPNPWTGLDFKPTVGHWAEYRMTPTGEKPVTMRISVVGKDGEHYWYESVIKDHEGQTVITKMLVSGDPQNEDNLKRMILKAPGQPAMEMPIQMMKGMGAQMGGMSQGKKPELPETKTVDLGVESVTVPAGTFKANHWQSTTEDFIFDAWVSEAVSPYGMVKGTSTDFEMILLSHGDGATSLITEEPQSMTMPGSPMGGKGGE